jgi:uracil phosphoribosyltransferase
VKTLQRKHEIMRSRRTATKELRFSHMLILTYLTYLFEVIRLLMVVEREGVSTVGALFGKRFLQRAAFCKGSANT